MTRRGVGGGPAVGCALCVTCVLCADVMAQTSGQLVPVNPATRDVSPLGVSNALQPMDLRQPTSWERVYEVRRFDNAATWRPSYRLGEVASAPGGVNAGASWYARANGGLVAVFPRSTYVQTPQGTYADVPPGTVYGIGGVPSSVPGVRAPGGSGAGVPVMPPNWAGGALSAHARPAGTALAATARSGAPAGANGVHSAPSASSVAPSIDAGGGSRGPIPSRAMANGAARAVPVSGTPEGTGGDDAGDVGADSAARAPSTRSIDVTIWSDEAYRARRIGQLIERAAKAE